MQIHMVLKLTKRCYLRPKTVRSVEPPSSLGRLKVYLLFSILWNVGFEPQKLTFSGIFSTPFLCPYRRKFSPSIKFFVHEVVEKIWKLIVAL